MIKLDTELVSHLLKSYAKDGPPPNCEINTTDLADCEEVNMTVTFLAVKSALTGDPRSAVAAALQIGFEIGLHYAQLRPINNPLMPIN